MPESKQHSFQTIISDDFERVNQCIREKLYSDVTLVNQISQYIVQSGGKRLRPVLVLLAANACGYKGKSHIPLAAIIELLHTATLLHDDVVDESNLRRGRDTANAVWGNAPSVLVGDFLYTRAFQMMVELDAMPLLQVLSKATNVLAEGEVMQLMNINDASVTEANYMEVIRCKTAMLFEASTHTAALLSGVNDEVISGLKDYGNFLGIAFQLVDDLLDYEGDSEAMGKNLGDDLAEGKPTLPLIQTLKTGSEAEKKLIREAIEQGGLEQVSDIVAAVKNSGALKYTARMAQEYSEKAIASLSVLPASDHRSALEDLARFAVARTY
ncbi:octaprenyl diphosphate synthase [Endozoicomonas sp. OPT23]|uniref:octaprenyl diphosphate synthase n=1 Tax=Endozoicomonas sp. OPT23 TaxID=2072845 RepID=UPI00129AF50F|nr:octaprenyl diphosphate synthase [Endozoicomonas sp. OPT23]MRI33757.1 octaprenyl diphosphate synthase [Endozoicomonas sp. OPT23]